MFDPAAMLDQAATFMATHARVLERCLFEAAFLDGQPAAALRALDAYRNEDGGYGHALEPDLRVGSSQPLFVQSALSALRELGQPAAALAEATCGFLASVAREDGALAYALPDALDAPRARHWNGDFASAPSLNATAGVAAGLHALGVEHAWLDRATTWCVAQVEGEPAYSGNTLRNVLDLLEHAPGLSPALWERATARLFDEDFVLLETPVTTYGLTPLHFAPRPDAPARALFDDEVIEAHLADLAGRQQADGGWPIHWNPPAGAARYEWRGRWTLEALQVLRAYGRLG